MRMTKLLSALEHHSNIVPWQMLCERTGAVLKTIPMNLDGAFDSEGSTGLLSDKTKLVFCNHISNAFGHYQSCERRSFQKHTQLGLLF